jgi:hypothetical protein
MTGETFRFEGIPYRIPISMFEFERVANQHTREGLVEFCEKEYGMEPRTTNIAWLSLKIGMFNFTGEDVIMHIIEALEAMNEH